MKHVKTRIVIALSCATALVLPLIAQTTPNAAAPAADKPAAAAPPAAVTAPAAKVAPDAVVISAGGDKVTAKEFDDFVAALPQQYQMMAQGPAKRQMAEQFAQMKLMAQEATKRGLDKTPKFAMQMKMMREQMLMNELLGDVQKSVDDAALKKYYDEHQGEFEQVKARHILVRTGVPATTQPGAKPVTDEEAKAKIDKIRARIAGGEDFAKVAKAESDDKHSGEEGGALGTFGRGQMVPDFEQAAFALKVGELSQPVKSPYGYHIIQVEEKKTQPFDEVKPSLSDRVAGEKVEAFVNDIKKNNKVELNDQYFGPPAPAGALPGGAPGAGGLPPQ